MYLLQVLYATYIHFNTIDMPIKAIWGEAHDPRTLIDCRGWDRFDRTL